MVRKAVIMARGLATRMRRPRPGVALGADQARAADGGLKALMPLNGRPLLHYIVDSLVRAGLEQLCLVIAPDAAPMRRAAAAMAEAAGVRIDCAVQEEPRGTADAVLAAERFVAGEPFLVCNGDNLYPLDALSALARKEGPDCWLAAFARDRLLAAGNIPAERLRHFAVVTVSDDGRLGRIVEKPADPERYARAGRLWLSMNLYRFSPVIFDYCRAVRPHPERGELELTAAVSALAAAGTPPVRVLLNEGGVLDLTERGDVPSAERALRGRRLCFPAPRPSPRSEA